MITPNVEVQVVPYGRGLRVDVQSRGFDTTGYPRREHALADLTLDQARRLEALLREAIRAAENAIPLLRPSWADAA